LSGKNFGGQVFVVECCLKYEQPTRLNIENSIDYRMLQKLISNAYFEQAGVLAAGSLMGELAVQ